MPIENVRSFDSERSIMAQERARVETSEAPMADYDSWPIESLLEEWRSISEQTEHMLQKQEAIRNIINGKMNQLSETASRIQDNFIERTGLYQKVVSEGIDKRERY